jgi:hypothetical protein
MNADFADSRILFWNNMIKLNLQILIDCDLILAAQSSVYRRLK